MMPTLIRIRPCLLGFAVNPDGWCPGVYADFHDVLWFLLNFPGDYTLVID